MINVSFHDLTMGSSELPAPRTAARSDTSSAFDKLMNEADRRQDVPAKDPVRERAPAPRDSHAETTRLSRSAEKDRHEPAAAKSDQSAGTTPVETSKTDQAPIVSRDTNSAASDDSHSADVIAQPAANTTSDGTEQTTVPATNTATTGDKPQQHLDAANTLTPTTQAPTQNQTQPQATAAPIDTMPRDTAPALTPQAAATPTPATQGADHPANPVPPSKPAASQTAALATAANAVPTTTPSSAPAIAQSSAGATPAQTEIAAAPTDATQAPAHQSTFDTLFAATLLAQSPSTESAITVPQGTQPIAAAQSTSANASPTLPLVTDMPARAAVPRASDNLTTGASVAQTKNQPAHQTPSTQSGADQLGSLLASEASVTVTRAEASSVVLKPAPALANGMVTQLNAMQQTDGQKVPSNGTATAAATITDSLTPSGSTPVQTATAIAAIPTVQPIADQAQQKTATSDNLVLNAPAPTGAAQANHGPATEAAAPAKSPLPNAPVAEQVAVHIAKAAAEGSDKISIKLKPATLGHIEVQLDVAPDGRVHAVIAVDKPETLDLLQRDARGLERALADAGLRADSGSLSFNLRGQGQQFGHGSDHSGFASYGRVPDRAGSDMTLLADAAHIGAYANSRAAAGGVDIRV